MFFLNTNLFRNYELAIISMKPEELKNAFPFPCMFLTLTEVLFTVS